MFRYTRSKPEAVILKRIVGFAHIAIKALSQHVIGNIELDFMVGFEKT